MELSCNPLFDRLRLMFFGNLYQSWSEFVLTELGLQQFESVSFTPESRPFQLGHEAERRQQIELALQLYQQSQHRKASLDYQLPESIKVPVHSLTLPKPIPLSKRVENAVIDYLSDTNTQLFHVENHLFTGLFALPFWPALMLSSY